MTVHKKVAEALGMAIPLEDQEESNAPLIVVEPHEIQLVDNPELPPMQDLEHKRLEGEKQLEDLITQGMSNLQSIYDQIENADPKYKSRNIEVFATLYTAVQNALKMKLESQMKMMKMRMDQKNFASKTGGGTQKPSASSVTNNYVFNGTREELIAMFDKDGEITSAGENSALDK